MRPPLRLCSRVCRLRSWAADSLGRLAVPLDRWCSRLQTDVVPTTRYAKSEEVNIAYQVFGDGSVDLVFVPGFISHIELAWEEPYLARFLRRLAAFTRVIFFDKRGTGLSDPVSTSPWPDGADG